MRFRHIRYVVLLGAFAIIGIIAIQGYFIKKEWTNKEKQFSQTVIIGLRNVASRIYAFNHTMPSTTNPVRQVSSNYFVVDLNSVIDANILEHYLKSEFSRLNIHTDFEYAIYNCNTDVMEYGNYFFYNGSVKEDAISVDLPKYQEYNYYFGVNFPLLDNTITGDMAIWFFMLGILGISVIFFAYSIFVILQQKRLSEMQRDFINNMTHEFKTPIASINISADVIINPDIVHEPSRLLTYGSIIKQEIGRLNDQVDKVLQIARIEKNGFHLKKEKFDLNVVILNVVENCRAQYKGDATINTLLVPGNVEVVGDQLHVTNIFYNLLDNAIKYAGPVPEVEILSKTEGDIIKVFISDNGPGISQEHQKKVFRKFYRVPTDNVHNVKGFGLGLFYVKSICEAHHWKIRLLPEQGKGAIFVLEIKNQAV
ncbi:MAG: HAMP domain-containing histidine kinase [Bacteroidales bacterium]|nr:HAMP domain-containing histidine kinase [Bacteroidales bacterium]